MWVLYFALVVSPVITTGLAQQTEGPMSSAAVCRDQERQAVDERCFKPFVLQYRQYKSVLTGSGPTCRADIFSCSSVSQLVNCLNSLPQTFVSNQCWPDIPQIITQLFQSFRVPCSYNDVYGACSSSSNSLLTADERAKTNNVPVSSMNQQMHRPNYHQNMMQRYPPMNPNPYMYQNSYRNPFLDLYMFNIMNGGVGPLGTLFSRLNFAFNQYASSVGSNLNA